MQTTAPGNVIELISDDGNEFTVNGTITTHDVGVSTAGTGGDGTFILQGGGGMPAAVPAMQGTSVTYGPFIRWTGGTSTDPILYMPDAHHCKVIRVGFHGNNQTTRLVKAGGQYVTFEGCWIGAPRTGGRCLWITGTTDTGYDAVAPQVRFCEIYGGGNNSWGIYIDDDTGGKEPTDGVITNTLVKGAEAGWVYSNSGGLIINGCHMTGNTDNVQGIVFNGGGPHIVVGCYLDTVKKGPVVQFNGGASLGKVVGNHFQNPKAAG
ncbi:MAG: hypothetical protein GWN18_13750, partial [Thermoplasmata archaeon]|nr:hypothetical protein [Thermoplasmata archaeon]NIS10695.1 hypothetical protein [Thermoplasmata archaeon]NIS21023.1 hypothetical protein [Thermoplasmata archaeon]NIT78488.1 hypothetical protein [Thermoplasmata archaeon]NIU50078.1 hypothetical protein [Thermoplasmata archaeon]